MPNVLITGGTGLVGKALTKELLRKGYHVIVLTRDTKTNKPLPGLSYASWDVDKQTIDEAALAGADYIVHLAGANVAEKRWTKERKQQISDSRIKSGELLCKALQKSSNNLKAFISASAIGWYGADPQIPNPRPFTEDAPPANDFLGTTCYQWEQSVKPVINVGKRLVILRTGIVLSNDGGALKEFKKPLNFGFATFMGHGRQVVSWIHIDDLVRLYIMAIENENLSGVYNAVAPAPTENKRLINELAKKIKGKYFTQIHIPEFLLKLMLGEMSIEVLKSVTVSSNKVIDAGFNFNYSTISSAIAQLVRKGNTKP